MPGKYITRAIEAVLRRAAREFPAIVLTGPRQSGKTTLLEHLFGKSHRYVSLEPPHVRAAASSDPHAFLEMNPPPVIFDELQHAPDLIPYIKEEIDAHRDKCGQYVLTGSQNLLLMQTVTESLAGRTAILRLLPLSRREAKRRRQTELPWEQEPGRSARELPSYHQLWREFLRGGYPELTAHPKRDVALWHASYVETYVERDVRSLRQIGDLTQFQSFLRALAARSAQLLNLADLARDLGIALNTVKAWLSMLSASYQVMILRPYFANVGKRLVKTPKVYFTDTGTLCYLAGLRDPEHAAAGPMGGAIMETAVLSEIVRRLTHQGVEPQIYFWRTSSGSGVDFVVDTGEELVPVEVKLSATPGPGMAAGIAQFREALPERAAKGYVVHPGKVHLPLGRDAIALPFAEL